MTSPQPIKALDQSVVNKIAAGEIIVAPVNALKELIENSVDAGSTSIDIVVRDGGLRLLQITDNGSGINRDDLPILCERFTTSKLKTFDDLKSIATYGFRGEALASISMIANLTVVTMTKDSNTAWKAVYVDGKLAPPKPGQSAEPKPCAGRQGTQITVQDLFYNTPTRRRAFRNTSDEYLKILDVVGRYAVHCQGVAFSCKKQGDNGTGLSTTANASIVDRIRGIHGSAVVSEVVNFSVSNRALGFEAKGVMSNANYHVKKTTLLLFINGRSVESSAIKKAVDGTYSTFLPKGGHPFVYLSIEIEPQRVDVNVHPTKREVNFLHEDEIIAKIAEAIQEQLAAVDTSRSYTLTQTVLPGVRPQPATASRVGLGRQQKDANPSFKPPAVRKTYENNTVRVDHRDQKITSMLQPAVRDASSVRRGADPTEYEYNDTQEWRIHHLATIKTLQEQVLASAHNGLAELFLGHSYVGLVDAHKRLAAVQHGVKLYLIDYGAVCREMFYHIGLSEFRNYGQIRFNPPLPLHELLEIAAEEEREASKGQSEAATPTNGRSNRGGGGAREEENTGRSGDDDDVVMGDSDTTPELNSDRYEGEFDWEGSTKIVERTLMANRAMLRDYFSLEISDDGELVSIPLLLKGYTPSLAKLPGFLLRLGPNVDWSHEMDCFETFLGELALFYVPEPIPPNSEEREKEFAVTLETVIFRAFRKRLIPTTSLLLSSTVTEIANLKGLYRIFERSC